MKLNKHMYLLDKPYQTYIEYEKNNKYLIFKNKTCTQLT